MPKTLLAVDDSATMRKVLEITFSGEDFDVVTADSAKSAIEKMSREPAVVVIDTVLSGEEDGYELAKKVRAQSKSAVIVLMASRYAPYDQAKGKEAGADDFTDKPFDTQQMIDKVKRAMVTRESGAGPQATAAVAQPAQSAPAPGAASPIPAAASTPKPMAAPPPRPAAAAAPAAPAAPKAAGAAPIRPGAGTLIFGQNDKPAPAPAPAASAASPAPPAVAAAVNGHLQGKLGDLGLSAAQVEAVLALSREVVERVVWEVVPQLAEALIKEEITRLTKDA